MENKRKYLYGASIQGIQNFILQSDALKDIVGASELVEKICTESFNEYGKKEENFIVKAAGNIKYVFDNKIECEKAVLEFPKLVMQKAPGITVSQAVVVYQDENQFSKAIDSLEAKLKAQRNKQVSTEYVFIAMRRSRQTGMPVVGIESEDNMNEYIDEATQSKRANAKKGNKNSIIELSRKCFGINDLKHEQIAYDIEKIRGKNDWIAIIHADGNGLGQVVQKIGKNKDSFKEFSLKLNQSTKEAAQISFKKIYEYFGFNTPNIIIPIRPVVLGGDDFTVICRGEFALEYAMEFLKTFEEKTMEHLGSIFAHNEIFENEENYLTACAGIAFIKSSYPFYFGYSLAEELCKEAKKDAKLINNKLAPSCLMFHKVQDSFIEDYNEIVERELKIVDNKTLMHGPYYLNETTNRWTCEVLVNNVKLLGKNSTEESKEANAVKSHLRQWLSDMYKDQELAEQKLKRLKSGIKNPKLKTLVEDLTTGNRIAAYDVLSLHSIMFNETNEEENL